METGGRKDVRYNILCQQVLPDGRGLEECGANVRFLPRRVGLSNTSVMVADLQSHTNYSFLLEAVNGVSELAKDHAKQYVSLNVTTNQAGTSVTNVIIVFVSQTRIITILSRLLSRRPQIPGVNIIDAVTKTPDDQIIAVFVQKICCCINFQ